MPRLGDGERRGDRERIGPAPGAEVGVLEAERHGAVRHRGAGGQRAAAGRDDRRFGLPATVAGAELGDALAPRLRPADEQALAEEVGEGAAGLFDDCAGRSSN